MNHYTVTLFQSPITRINQKAIMIPYKKAEGLWYYLCVKKRATREELASLFWADSDITSARSSLRDAIYRLRTSIGPDVLLIEGKNYVSLNPEADIAVDLDEISEENILQTYHGPFCEFFYIRGCLEFEEWTSGLRDQYRRMYVRALKREIKRCISLSKTESVSEYASRLFQEGEFDEELVMGILEFFAHEGAYQRANIFYRDYVSKLNSQLDLAPSREIEELYQGLARVDASPQSVDETEGFFYGRQQQLFEINSEIQRFSLDKPYQSILVYGEAGVGKSALLSRVRKMDGDAILIAESCMQAQSDMYFKPWYGVCQQLLAYLTQKGLWER